MVDRYIEKLPKMTWDFNESPSFTFDATTTPSDVCEHLHPHVCLDLHKKNQLNEATYKEIASLVDNNFLNQKIRADELSRVKLDSVQGDTMFFTVPSSEFSSNRVTYSCMVKFDQWDEVGQDRAYKGYEERARMLLWAGDIRLHCTCPSFLYWGYQYILSVLDASIEQETRKPNIRNPGDRGVVCKHLNRVLRVLPFYNGDIAKALKTQFRG